MRDQIVMLPHIHTHKTWMSNWWTSNRYMYFFGARIPQQLDERTCRITAHNTIIDHYYSFIAHILVDNIELQRHAALAQRIRRLNKRPPHVTILDKAIVIRNPTYMRKTDRRRHRRIWHRNHHIRFATDLTAIFTRQFLPQSLPHFMNTDPAPDLVSTRKINMFEHTHCSWLHYRQSLRHSERSIIGKRHDLTRLHIADGFTAQRLQCARFRCHGVSTAWQQPNAQRTKAPRIAHCLYTISRQNDQRIRTDPFLHGMFDALFPRLAAIARQHHRHHFSI